MFSWVSQLPSFFTKMAQFLSLAGTGTRPAVPSPGTRTGSGPRTAVSVISWVLHSYIGSFSLHKRKQLSTMKICKLVRNFTLFQTSCDLNLLSSRSRRALLAWSWRENSTTPVPSRNTSAKMMSPASRKWSLTSCQEPVGGRPETSNW